MNNIKFTMLENRHGSKVDMTHYKEKEIRRLMSGLELNEGNYGFYLCVCDSDEVKQRILDELSGKFEVIASNNPDEQYLMMQKLVEKLDQQQEFSKDIERKKIILIPNSSFENEEYGNLWRFICHRLNEWRERFRLNYPNHLIFILSSEAYKILMEEASDFYSVRSGVYELSGEFE